MPEKDFLLKRARDRSQEALKSLEMLGRRVQGLLGGKIDGYSIMRLEIIPAGFQCSMNCTTDEGGVGTWNFVAHLGTDRNRWPFEIAHQLDMMAFRADEASQDMQKLIDSPKPELGPKVPVAS